MAVRDVILSIDNICNSIVNDETAKNLTNKILTLFCDMGLTYKTKERDNKYRVYCYIKKSKEALIINTIGDKHGVFELQLRIKDKTVFEKLGDFSENIKDAILNRSRNCKHPHCCNCGSEYVFTHNNKKYRKCHMLCDNFLLYNLNADDVESVLDIIKSEIMYGIGNRTTKSI
jgi:hypothetical protein